MEESLDCYPLAVDKDLCTYMPFAVLGHIKENRNCAYAYVCTVLTWTLLFKLQTKPSVSSVNLRNIVDSLKLSSIMFNNGHFSLV